MIKKDISFFQYNSGDVVYMSQNYYGFANDQEHPNQYLALKRLSGHCCLVLQSSQVGALFQWLP